MRKIEEALQLTTEYFNFIDIADLSLRDLNLKYNTVIILLQDLFVSEGLCNRTIVKGPYNKISKAKKYRRRLRKSGSTFYVRFSQESLARMGIRHQFTVL